MSSTLTGYGPSKQLLFDGDESKYELWEVKFLGHVRRQKLLDVLTGTEAPDDAKNTDAYAELVQLLDDRSLSLVFRDAKDEGSKSPSRPLYGHR